MKIFFLISLFCLHAHSQIEEFEKKCLAGDGLSCAKAAYHFKKTDTLMAYQFYKKGCELKDESACFNMNSYDPKDVYFKKVDRAIAPHSHKIRTCYIPQVKGKKYSAMQFKENFYTADFKFPIDPEGNAFKIDVKTGLDKKFIDCAKNVLTSIKYPRPEGFVPTYQFQMQFSAFE
ncbi:MAG: hypothetical protein V4598_07940 [Bdellovibrionota bacterium]